MCLFQFSVTGKFTAVVAQSCRAYFQEVLQPVDDECVCNTNCVGHTKNVAEKKTQRTSLHNRRLLLTYTIIDSYTFRSQLMTARE